MAATPIHYMSVIEHNWKDLEAMTGGWTPDADRWIWGFGPQSYDSTFLEKALWKNLKRSRTGMAKLSLMRIVH